MVDNYSKSEVRTRMKSEVQQKSAEENSEETIKDWRDKRTIKWDSGNTGMLLALKD